MTSFSARITSESGGHAYVSVFAGPDADHRAHVGRLVMRPDEAGEFVAIMEMSGRGRQEHVLQVRDGAWTLEHSFPCRVRHVSLMDCPVTGAAVRAESLLDALEEAAWYVVDIDDEGVLNIHERI